MRRRNLPWAAIALNFLAVEWSGAAGPKALIVLPLLGGFLLLIENHTVLNAVVVCVNYGLILTFGFLGDSWVPWIGITTALMALSLTERWWRWGLAAGLWLMWAMFFLPPLGQAYPSGNVLHDHNNVSGIICMVRDYREDLGDYPATLSGLSNMVNLTGMYTCPRGAGQIDRYREGPFRLWGREPYPGPVRPVRSWSEVDQGDYLYVYPGTAAPPNTIILMTRPGLLYRNQLNVGHLNGLTETLEAGTWKSRADIQSFLRAAKVAPSLTGIKE